MQWVLGCGGVSLAAIVGGGFGVDEESADLGVFEFEGAFEGGDDGVDFGSWGGRQARVQWQLTWMRSWPWLGMCVTRTSWISRISG